MPLFRRPTTALLILAVAAAAHGIAGEAQAAQSGRRLLVDQTGRTISVPANPQRVVSLAPSITEIVFALDQGRRLKGATRFSDYPPEARALPKVGSYIHLDLEKIVALDPDLCIAVKDGNPKEVVTRLEGLGIPVYAVDPRDLASVMATILEIGRLLNVTGQAERIVQDMQRRIARVRQKVDGIENRPRVFFQIGISPIVSVGTHTLIHEIIVAAGGTNAAAGPVTYPRYSREQVLVLAPDILIITSMARQAVFEEVKAAWQKWPDLPAVKSGRIHLVDSDLFDRPSPRLVEGLERLARLIHPRLFAGRK
jgi:iron complex transport system substrate-binding protein